jgi:hypothetical protein
VPKVLQGNKTFEKVGDGLFFPKKKFQTFLFSQLYCQILISGTF